MFLVAPLLRAHRFSLQSLNNFPRRPGVLPPAGAALNVLLDKGLPFVDVLLLKWGYPRHAAPVVPMPVQHVANSPGGHVELQLLRNVLAGAKALRAPLLHKGDNGALFDVREGSLPATIGVGRCRVALIARLPDALDSVPYGFQARHLAPNVAYLLLDVIPLPLLLLPEVPCLRTGRQGQAGGVQGHGFSRHCQRGLEAASERGGHVLQAWGRGAVVTKKFRTVFLSLG